MRVSSTAIVAIASSGIVWKSMLQRSGVDAFSMVALSPMSSSADRVGLRQRRQPATEMLTRFATAQEESSSTVSEPAADKQATSSDSISVVNEKSNNGFVNEGPFAWMEPYLDAFGIKEGKSLEHGFLPVNVDPSKQLDEKEAQSRRQNAADNLRNIGDEERMRRADDAVVAAYATFAYAVIVTLFVDVGDFAGSLARFSTVVPLFLTLGYKESADTGLWNIAQAGYWDVDNTGLSKIDDPKLARAILDKVNAMNTVTIAQSAAIASIFALLPHQTAVSMAVVSVVLFALYARQKFL